MDISGIGLNALLGRYGANASQSAGDLGEATSRLIQKKDKDGNGTLSAVEISISEEGFKRADANQDGELDADELKNSVDTIAAELMAQKPPRPSLDEMTERLIRDLDEDGDGGLSSEEISISSELFEEADTDGDGILSFDELKTASKAIGEELRDTASQGPPPNAEAMTKRLIQERDQDGDGALSAEELPISSEVFDAADTNQDGVLNFDELVAAGEAIGEELRPEQGPPRPNLFEQFFSLKSDDDDAAKTTFDQIL